MRIGFGEVSDWDEGKGRERRERHRSPGRFLVSGSPFSIVSCVKMQKTSFLSRL